MRVSFVDSGERASQVTTWTSAGILRASRTCSGGCWRVSWNWLTATRNGSPRGAKKSIDAKQAASRRVSTRTIAATAPHTRSSHMNQNRCWPGVPNRYRIRSLSNETRPKSIATVVVTLFGVADRSSTPRLASVITASVVNGTISDTDPTNVVLPTPKPPATTIFVDMVGLAGDPGRPRAPELIAGLLSLE